jgi:ERCC4-type nuclease
MSKGLRRLTVLIDTREKLPITFPASLKFWPDKGLRPVFIPVSTKKVTMKTGDYALKGFEDTCIIERKGSVRELHNNLLTKDWSRCQEAFKRLARATDYPYLLLEIPSPDFLKVTKDVPNPERVFDILTRLVHKYDFRLWFAGNCKHPRTRRALGEQMIRVMLAHALG